MNETKYLTKPLLREINDAAIREGRNRAVMEEFVESLPDDAKFPIVWFMYHAKNEIRIMVHFGPNHGINLVDISQFRYDTLPGVTFHDDGSVEFEDPAISMAKRPYPNGREWQEKVVMKPVRDQHAFRREVLNAYGRQCALCSISEPSLLRAAHIVDVAAGGSDDISNGICLCVNHEIAYDKGIIVIREDFTVEVNSDSNIQSTYDRVRLPEKRDLWPSKENLSQKSIVRRKSKKHI
ncbi:HNH endonuclease [Azospirillum argentinense]|uniref:HNH nuclease domain-containing protein n=1 Tax=Azospirillum argentinense TaxID=2970906 RepID=A0A5B0KR20_9PROT|nr:HNH endonuclease [Azospirillum argentinense]KAA1054689.1 hypothetical protein FH063_005965 [Azospirillum argentinense]